MVGHRVEITWPINPLPPSKRKKHGKNISQIDIYGVSRCKPIPPHTQKKKPVSSTSNRHKLNNYMTIWSKKIISKSAAAENAKLTSMGPHDPLLTESGGWTDRAQLCITSFKFRAVLVSCFFGFHHAFPTLGFWDGVTHQDNMCKARKISRTKTSIQLKLQ